MPVLLLSDKVAATLQELASGGRKDPAFTELQTELRNPPKPDKDGANYPEGTIVNHQCLVRIAKWAASAEVSTDQDLSLSTLLKGSKIVVPIMAKPVRSPELIETLRRIQLAKEEEEYEEMLNPSQATKGKSIAFGFQNSKEKQSPWQTKSNRTEAEEWEEVRRQLGAIANVGLSVAAVVTATWWAAGNANPIWKTLVALPLGLLVGVAEVVLYARHWDNVQKKKEKSSLRR